MQGRLKKSYNERLFDNRGMRSWLHNARFNWFRRAVGRYLAERGGGLRAVELGCFDGRLLAYFPEEPVEYWGFDAGWEGGLSEAQEEFARRPSWRFIKATEPQHLAMLPDNYFDVAASLETLEHVPPEMVAGYLHELSRVTRGYFFVTVPNEKGAVFLAKHIVKNAAYGGAQKYRMSEVIYATAGLMHKVERYDHKGFDYGIVIKSIEEEFNVVQVSGLPFNFIPHWLSPTVTIIARPKRVDVSPSIRSRVGAAVRLKGEVCNLCERPARIFMKDESTRTMRSTA
jgi:SAM-dependent methyltransferase